MICAAFVLQHFKAVQLAHSNEDVDLAEIPCAMCLRARMSPPMKGSRIARSVIAAFLSAAFLWTLTLSVSPQLHERFHPDANRAEHVCAVTFVASGSYDHGVPGSLV